MTDRPTVEILLATYNGARFLREQVDSVLAQDYPTLRILVSDDGSDDETLAILDQYRQVLPLCVRILEGLPPTGSAPANFLRLMQHATASYVCFCDQDDVWLPGKVRCSLEAMRVLEQKHGTGMPLLVFTDLRVVDHDLKTMQPSMWATAGIVPGNVHRLERLLTQSIVTGCTMMINRPLLELAKRMPPEASMHDRWIALLAGAMGASAFLREPQVLYRQHDCNVVGAVLKDNSIAGLWFRLRNRGERTHQRKLEILQVEALQRQHGTEMPPAGATLLGRYLESSLNPNPFRRIWLTLRYGFFRQGLLSNFALFLEPFRGKD